jgi:hypothetical protein
LRIGQTTGSTQQSYRRLSIAAHGTPTTLPQAKPAATALDDSQQLVVGRAAIRRAAASRNQGRDGRREADDLRMQGRYGGFLALRPRLAPGACDCDQIVPAEEIGCSAPGRKTKDVVRSTPTSRTLGAMLGGEVRQGSEAQARLTPWRLGLAFTRS